MIAECRILGIGLAALLTVAAGCGGTGGAKGGAAAKGEPVVAKGRAQLWSENCQRCHNARPSSWYSEREWEVAMHHMLVRGYLTRHEHDSVMEFFRAAR